MLPGMRSGEAKPRPTAVSCHGLKTQPPRVHRVVRLIKFPEPPYLKEQHIHGKRRR